MSVAAADASTASWIQTGGVLAFASLVMWHLRDLKPTLEGVKTTLVNVQLLLAGILERERMKGENRARRAIARANGVPDAVGDELTEPINVPELLPPKQVRARTAPGGYSIQRPRGGEGG
jgi:hypothetical protein